MNAIVRLVGASLVLALLSGCSSFAYVNQPRGDVPPPPGPPPASDRATLAVDGNRGNPRVLMFLTMSGGGSRAAVWATEAMLQLQSALADVDLLAEVDVVSAVSGGSMAGAYYAVTRDNDLCNRDLAARLNRLGFAPLDEAVPAALRGARTNCPAVAPRAPARATDRRAPDARAPDAEAPDARAPGGADALAGVRSVATLAADPASGRIVCWAPLDTRDRERLASALLPPEVRRIADLCAQADPADLPRRGWNGPDAREAMRRDYLLRWLLNMLWPTNIARYWFTAFDRSDIMADTLADNLYDTPGVGRNLALKDLNPARPYLIVNATQSSTQGSDDDYSFGSIFTFTGQDFRERLDSDIASYPIARAVMASSAFPLVFANSTLRDFRPHPEPYCELPEPDGSARCSALRYLHVFDGGNADNLGLRSVKRILLQMAADQRLDDYDAIVVITVDAYGRPRGASPISPDTRGLLGLFLDPNLTDAVDSLLQANRARLLEEFESADFGWRRDCAAESRHLPQRLCDVLEARATDVRLDDKLVFYHVGFADVLAFAEEGFPARQLKSQLDAIPTSFRISDAAAELLREAARRILGPSNPCLVALGDLVQQPLRSPLSVQAAKIRCSGIDRMEPRDRQVDRAAPAELRPATAGSRSPGPAWASPGHGHARSQLRR